MKRNDWFLAVGIIFAALIVMIVQILSSDSSGQIVTITADGKMYGTYSLYSEKIIEIGSGNRILIQNGTVRMEWADCPDQICVHHKEISRNGESIICLPNRVAVTIDGGRKNELDGIAG